MSNKINSKKNSKKLKPQLYNDLHPEKSLKNTGFKNSETAVKTIELVSKRSLRYQFDLINTMYNRAKYHPHKTKLMEQAMKIFQKWLKKYPKLRYYEDKNYKFLTLEQIKKYEKIAEIYKVNEIIRGIKKGIRTDKGFLQIYKEVNGKANKLQYIPIKLDKPEGQDYWSYRIEFINSRIEQMKKQNIPLYYLEGKYKDLPTKQHIILILHGYSPDKKLYLIP